MATEAKTRSSYVTPSELEMLLRACGEKIILRERSITAAAGEAPGHKESPYKTNRKQQGTEKPTQQIHKEQQSNKSPPETRVHEGRIMTFCKFEPVKAL
ncbi:Hypothetical protein SMAX5B_003307 [Scophthalmus maximus]|uniref:Uncharacterized protein n=1 Tax=Scophthalmus maximus TaxID=52904 RepID=A0A2U9CDN4_SCOMX|nr:Hypothetical protein SMAX5B_003307 [Scophthalmus maximus]